MWLLPADTVRADHMVHGLRESEALPVRPHLLVPARERVRDEPDDQAPILAPAERFRCPGHQRTDKIQRKRGRYAKVVDLDVVNTDLAVAKPIRVPAVRLLAQVRLGLVPMVRSALGLDEPVVPGA